MDPTAFLDQDEPSPALGAAPSAGSTPRPGGLDAPSAPAPSHVLPPAMRRDVLKSLPLKAVVKIFVTTVSTKYDSPWRKASQRRSTGTGFAISCQRLQRCILTNAHVVYEATQVRVRKPGCATKFSARVAVMGREVDLAVLEVDDPEFWSGMELLSLSRSVPKLDSDVTAVGYPRGGDGISVTRGVVSRVVLHPFAPGGASLVTVQIDAAINAGNSGGPVFDGSRQVVGVARSHHTRGQNIGYIISVPTLRLFLAHVDRHGRFCGVSSLGCRLQTLESPAFRAKLGLHRVRHADNGIRVASVAPVSSLHNKLFPDDVLLGIRVNPIADGQPYHYGDTPRAEIRADPLAAAAAVSTALGGPTDSSNSGSSAVGASSGDERGVNRVSFPLASLDVPVDKDGFVPIASDGTVPLARSRLDERLFFTHLVSTTPVGRSCDLLILRCGTEKIVSCILEPMKHLVPILDQVDCSPQYLLVGGLVLVPLSRPWIEAMYTGHPVPSSIAEKLIRFAEGKDQGVVVLSRVLAATVNFGFQNVRRVLVTEFCGTPIRNLQHLSEMVRDCKDEFLQFKLDDERVVALNRLQSEQSLAPIMQQHSISAPCRLN